MTDTAITRPNADDARATLDQRLATLPEGERVAHLVELAAALEEDNEAYRERLRLVGGAAKVGIWDYDFRHRELWVSDELAAIYGVEPGELTWPAFVSRIHPDDVPAEVEQPTPSFPFGSVNEFFFRVRHADGRYRSIRSRSVTVGEGGTPHRKLGAHIDMSEDALLSTNERLAEANERLRQFAYLVSHDLRSPLRGVRSLLAIAAEDHGEDLPAEVLEVLDMVEDRVGRMGRLVDDLLTYATSDLASIEPELCDIGQLVDDIIATLDYRASKVEVDAATVACRVPISPLTVCVRNLVDNACKHHHRADGTVAVAAEVTDGWLVITVADDGPGIPEGAIGRIYDAFYSSNRAEGSGLGLAHVRRAIEKYSAVLECDSEVGRGTTFTIRWPLGSTSAQTEPPA